MKLRILVVAIFTTIIFIPNTFAKIVQHKELDKFEGKTYRWYNSEFENIRCDVIEESRPSLISRSFRSIILQKSEGKLMLGLEKEYFESLNSLKIKVNNKIHSLKYSLPDQFRAIAWSDVTNIKDDILNSEEVMIKFHAYHDVQGTIKIPNKVLNEWKDLIKNK